MPPGTDRADAARTAQRIRSLRLHHNRQARVVAMTRSESS